MKIVHCAIVDCFPIYSLRLCQSLHDVKENSQLELFELLPTAFRIAN